MNKKLIDSTNSWDWIKSGLEMECELTKSGPKGD
jgi:hypothetical protein